MFSPRGVVQGDLWGRRTGSPSGKSYSPYDGLPVRRTRRSKRKHAAKPQATAFLRVQTSDSTKVSIEIKLPEAGERLEAIGVREHPLTTYHLPHMPPSGRLDVLGVRLSSAAYARRQFLCRPPD